MTFRILLTGSPGSGKTTTAARVADNLQKRGLQVGGVLTHEVRIKGRRIGFDLVPFHGQRTIMARVGLEGRETVGRYGVDVGAVDAVSKKILHRLRELPSHAVLLIDELGRMEAFSREFVDLVDAVLDGPWSCLLTVTKSRVPLACRVLDRQDLERFDLDEVDRERLPGELARALAPQADPSR